MATQNDNRTTEERYAAATYLRPAEAEELKAYVAENDVSIAHVLRAALRDFLAEANGREQVEA